MPVILLVFTGLIGWTVTAGAQGFSDKEILIGMSNALSGPSQALGKGVTAGAMAYIDALNRQGGVNGRKIKVISMDDGYEPDRAVANTKKLIEDKKVFILFNYVGTPTSSAVVPLVKYTDIPYVAPFTGAEFLRNPVNKNVYNIRASYFDETEDLVAHFVDDLKIKKIGILIQEDAYGAAGEAGVSKALQKRGMKLAGKGTYKRNTTDVKAAIGALKADAPEAVIMIGAYAPCAAFVKEAKAASFTPKLASVSFIGTSAFVKELKGEGDGVYITQVVPFPWDKSKGIVKDYQRDMKAEKKGDLDFTSLEGYIGADIMVRGLKEMKGTDRNAFREAMDHIQADLDGFIVDFSATDHSGSKKVYLTQVKKGKAVSITKF